MANPEVLYPKNSAEWRKWLEKNHQTQDSVWAVFHSKASKKESLTWSESVDQALCFGWIDSKKVKIDASTSHQFFTKRKAKSTWSKINKEKVERLIQAGLMTQAGYDIIEVAKQNGSWTLLDDAENLIIPPDLEKAFSKNKNAKEKFLALSKSNKKLFLMRLILAKQQETRYKRIQEILEYLQSK